MNVTQDQKNTPLHEHYNLANQYFQDGQFQKALQELEEAKKCATNDTQTAHIENSIRTVTEMMQQNESETDPVSDPQEPQSSGGDSNKLLLITVLVGLICLTPIVMKLIEIFSQPSSAPKTQDNVATAPVSPGTKNQASAGNDPETPSASPDLIVNSEVSETQAVANAPSALVLAEGVNVRDQPSTSGNKVATLSINQSVSVLKEASIEADGYTWSKIETSAGTSGWVASKFIQSSKTSGSTPANADSASSTASVDNAATRLVSASGVALRSEPGAGKPLVTSLTQARVTVLEDKAVTADGYVWSKVRTKNGSIGWLADKFLSE